MSPIRRLTALLTGVLVLQLTLLGAVAPCMDLDAAQAAMAGHNDMNPAAPADHESCGESTPESSRPASSGGSSCIAMLSCVSPMLQLVAQPAVAGAIVITRIAAAPVLEPPTRNTAPELPPPRV